MSDAPERLWICTVRPVDSDFASGIIFGHPGGPSEQFGTVEYVRADLIPNLSQKEGQSDGNKG